MGNIQHPSSTAAAVLADRRPTAVPRVRLETRPGRHLLPLLDRARGDRAGPRPLLSASKFP